MFGTAHHTRIIRTLLVCLVLQTNTALPLIIPCDAGNFAKRYVGHKHNPHVGGAKHFNTHHGQRTDVYRHGSSEEGSRFLQLIVHVRYAMYTTCS